MRLHNQRTLLQHRATEATARPSGTPPPPDPAPAVAALRYAIDNHAAMPRKVRAAMVGMAKSLIGEYGGVLIDSPTLGEFSNTFSADISRSLDRGILV